MNLSAERRLASLDCLRLVSALMVLGFHFFFRMGMTGEGGQSAFPELSPIFMWMDAGLLIFFAISGYVIALSSEGRSPLAFLKGRFLRLWPTFVVAASISTLVLCFLPVPGQSAPTLQQWLAQGLMISRLAGQPFIDGAYWTIAYEITFYGWVFLLLWAGLFQRHWAAVVLVWLAISVVNEEVLMNGAIGKVFITEFSGFFAFGLALFKWQKARDYKALAIMALAFAWACREPFLSDAAFIKNYGLGRPEIGLLLVGPLSLCLFTLFASLRRIPISPSLALQLGALTYPLYLLHQNIGYAVFNRFGTPENRWIVLGIFGVLLISLTWLVSAKLEPWMRARLSLVLDAAAIACMHIRSIFRESRVRFIREEI